MYFKNYQEVGCQGLGGSALDIFEFWTGGLVSQFELGSALWQGI